MRRAFAVLLAGLIGACGSPAPSLEASAAPEVGLSFPANTLVACDERLPFQLAALAQPAAGELGGDEAAATLRAFLQGPEAARVYPRAGWRRVAEQAEANALFVAPGNAETPWLQVVTERAADGTWSVVTHGQCHLRVLFQEDATTATWWLDPTVPAPEPHETTVHALVLEQACASGRTAEGRILRPVILSRPEAVIVAIGVRRAPGNQDCPGHPPTPFEFELPEPLGDRPLFDGGPVPPRDAREPAG